MEAETALQKIPTRGRNSELLYQEPSVAQQFLGVFERILYENRQKSGCYSNHCSCCRYRFCSKYRRLASKWRCSKLLRCQWDVIQYSLCICHGEQYDERDWRPVINGIFRSVLSGKRERSYRNRRQYRNYRFRSWCWRCKRRCSSERNGHLRALCKCHKTIIHDG